MADETKTIKIKVQFEGEAKGAEEAAQKVEKATDEIAKAQKQSTETFGIMDTQMGKSAKGVIDFGKKGVQAFTSLKGAIAATGIGLLVIAIAGLVEWFKKTKTGADILEKGMKMLGQVVKEGPIMVFNALKLAVQYLLLPLRTVIATFQHMKAVLTGKESIKEAVQGIKDDVKALGQEMVDTAGKIVDGVKNIGEAGKLFDKWDALEERRLAQMEEFKRIEADIADLRDQAAQQETTAIQKVALLNKAREKQLDLNKKILADKKEELALAEEELALYPDNQEWIEKIAQLKADVADAERQSSMDNRKLTRELNSAERTAQKEQEEEDKAKAEEDANARMEAMKAEYGNAEKIKLDHLGKIQVAEQITADKLVEITAKRAATQEEIDKALIAAKLKMTKDEEQIALASASDSLKKFAEVAGKQSKLGKAMAIAAAVIDTYQSAIAAFKSMAGIPVVGPALGVVAAAAAVALGLKNIAQIRKTEPEKKALGGWIGGTSHLNGGTPIIAEAGEFMVNRQTMKDPQMAESIIQMNQAGINGGSSAPMITEERVAQIAAQVVRSIPVVVDRETSNKIGQEDRKVQQRESNFVQG